MALYPPPSSNVPVFNVDLFSNTIGYGSTNYATSLVFPNAQGEEIWTDGATTTTINKSLIQSTTLAFGAPAQGLSFNFNGINTVNTSDTLNIGASQTSGILNLGTGTGRTATGVINIGNSTGVAPIYIETGSILNTDATPAIAIGTSVSAKTIKIGHNGSSTISLINVGNLQLRSAINEITLNCIAAPTTNDIYIGNTQSSGVLYIGTGGGTARSGSINIAHSNNNTCQVNMMTGNTQSGSINMYTGNTTAGTVNIATGTGITQTTIVNIGSGTTTGTLTLGNSANTTTINSGTLDVRTGTGTTLLPLGGTINLATGTGLGFVSTAVNIGTGNTNGTVTLGNSNNGTTINSNVITANGTLTMGTDKNITLKNNGVAPASGTQLGGTVAGTINSFGASGYIAATLTIVTPGVYIFNYNIQVIGTGFLTTPVLYFTKLVGAAAKTVDNGHGVVNATNLTSGQTQIILATATAYNVTASFGATITGRDAVSYFTATRIG